MTRACFVAILPLAAIACTPKEPSRSSPQDVAQPSMPAASLTPPVHDSAVAPIARDCPHLLLAARRGGTDADRYVVPTDGERSAMRDAVARILAGGASSRAVANATASAAGYEIVDVPEISGAVLLREIESRRRGGGAYVLRLDAGAHVVVQAPHTFFDEGTLPLACELFERARAAALFIDTAHRYKSAEPDEKGEHPADVAHADASLFQAATDGALRASPKLTAVQLHGFATRESAARLVVSSGANNPGDALVARAARLLAPIAGKTQRFPDDTLDLGATKNVQGKAVRDAGGRFLHVEMQAGLRRDLLSDESLRARFLDALARAIEDR